MQPDKGIVRISECRLDLQHGCCCHFRPKLEILQLGPFKAALNFSQYIQLSM